MFAKIATAAPANEAIAGKPLLPPEHPRVKFTVAALRALASLRVRDLGLRARGEANRDARQRGEDVSASDAALIADNNAVRAARVALYRAAADIDKRFPHEDALLPLADSLRAFSSDDHFEARRWPSTLDTFVGALSPTLDIEVSPRSLAVLAEMRVAATYGMVDAAMVIIDENMRFENPARRASIELRFRALAQRAAHQLRAEREAVLAHTRAARAAETEPAPAPVATDPHNGTEVAIPGEPVASSTLTPNTGEEEHGQQEDRSEEARQGAQGAEGPEDPAAGADAGAVASSA